MIDAKFVGMERVRRNISDVKEAAQKAAADAMERGANEVVDTAKSFVPYRDGALRRSIGWTWGNAPAGSISIGTIRGRQYSALRITIYAGNKEAFYARFQEFGTVKMAANPFFFVAWRINRRRIKSRVTRETNKAIKRAFTQ